jgi:hypothetical protein
VATVAANGSRIAVQPQRGYFSHFQRHFNKLKDNTAGFPPTIALKLAPIAGAPRLAVDGLVGDRTIFAQNLAHAAQIGTGISWENLIKIVGPD